MVKRPDAGKVRIRQQPAPRVVLEPRPSTFRVRIEANGQLLLDLAIAAVRGGKR